MTKLDELRADQSELSDTATLMAADSASDEAGGIKLAANKSSGKLVVSGQVGGGDSFKALVVMDNNGYWRGNYGLSGTSFSMSLAMDQFPVGAYYIVAQTVNGRTYFDVALTLIYSTPANKKSMYETYSKYLYVTPSGAYYPKDTTCGVYVDIKAKGAKKWKSYGPLSSSASTIKGLKPDKKYQVRVYYGKTVTINEKSFFFSGKENGKYKTITIKTGKKKMQVKSVSVKAVSIRKHTHKRYGPYTGIYLGKETWYTYRLQVTVKLKKKPGVKGIYINGKKVKGNKKTYTTKFATTNTILSGRHVYRKYKNKWWRQDDTYKIPRGSSYKVILYSYNHKSYKAYSPLQTRKCKIR